MVSIALPSAAPPTPSYALTLCVVLWVRCTLSYTKEVLGQMGVVAMVPLVTFFATGILEKSELCLIHLLPCAVICDVMISAELK